MRGDRDRWLQAFRIRQIRAPEEAARAAQDYLAQSAPVGPYLADQLLLPMALGGMSEFVTCEPTLHFRSNAEVIALFTGKRIIAARDGNSYVIAVR